MPNFLVSNLRPSIAPFLLRIRKCSSSFIVTDNKGRAELDEIYLKTKFDGITDDLVKSFDSMKLGKTTPGKA